MRTDIHKITRKMRKGVPEDDEKGVCYRGLEWRVERIARHRKRLREDSFYAVWKEQSRQWKEDICSPELIKEAYFNVTYISAQAALHRGVQDSESCLRAWTSPASMKTSCEKDNICRRFQLEVNDCTPKTPGRNGPNLRRSTTVPPLPSTAQREPVNSL